MENQQNNQINVAIPFEEDKVSTLLNLIKQYANPENILERINPKLKIIYDNRVINYEKKNELESSWIKIPKVKLNNEERLLLACLATQNLKEDLNELLEYCEKMLDVFQKVHPGKLDMIHKNEDELVKFIFSNAVTNFFSSKVKLYFSDENDDDIPLKEPVKMTEEEIKKELEEFQNHPLFMTELPEKPEDNPYLATLQSLQYEGNPAEVSEELMEKSQEALDKYKTSKNFEQLKESMFYICNAIDHVKDDSTVPDQLKYDLYYFRTQIQLMVKNYGYAVEDLKSALFHIDNDEAYFSLIECYVAQECYDKALKVIRERMKYLEVIDLPEEKAKYRLYKIEEGKIFNYIKELEEKLEKMETFKNLENKEKLKLYDMLTRRGIKVKPQLHKVPANVEANIYLDEDRLIHFPILIIYEEFNVTDYIQDVDEKCMISDIFEILFGDNNRLPWDKENKYKMNTCTAFYELSKYDTVMQRESNYYLPLRNDDKLIDILTNKQVYMSGFPVIVILSQISNFFGHFVKNKMIIKRK